MLVSIKISLFCVTLCAASPLIERTFSAIEQNLNYIDANVNHINVDCLFGVVLANAFLSYTYEKPEAYRQSHRYIEHLRDKTDLIYKKTVPLLQNTENWHFAGKLVDPALWMHPYKITKRLPKITPKKGRVDALFSANVYDHYNESFSDGCLSDIVMTTSKERCKMAPACIQYVNEKGENSGYIITHRLLLLQVARARNCSFNRTVLDSYVLDICTSIYEEVKSVEKFDSLDRIFDLFLEEILLCGMEGFKDFFKLRWLNYVLKKQNENGCFTVQLNKRKIRDANYIGYDGCVDHTTGLGAAFLALYINYLQ